MTSKFALALPLCLAIALPAAAQTLGTNPQAVLSVAQEFGQAQMDTPDSEGRPLMTGTLDETRYGILMYGCNDADGCDSVQFFATFETATNSLEFLNQWNMDKRFGSAYREEDGDVILHYSANLDFGVERQNFHDTFDIWQITLGQFVNRLDGLPDDGVPQGTTPTPSK